MATAPHLYVIGQRGGMMLVGLIGSLSATSRKVSVLNDLSRFRGCLSGLSAPTSENQAKKLNVLNASQLIGLVAPTESVGADKPRLSRSRSAAGFGNQTYTLWTRNKFMETVR